MTTDMFMDSVCPEDQYYIPIYLASLFELNNIEQGLAVIVTFVIGVTFFKEVTVMLKQSSTTTPEKPEDKRRIRALEDRLRALQERNDVLADGIGALKAQIEQQNAEITANNKKIQQYGGEIVTTTAQLALPPVLPLEALLLNLPEQTTEGDFENINEFERGTYAIEDNTATITEALSGWLKEHADSRKWSFSFWHTQNAAQEKKQGNSRELDTLTIK